MQLTITAIYAGLLGIMLVVISTGVIRERGRAQVSLGDGGNKRLNRWIRVQGNFSEYVPMGLILMALAEFRGAPELAVHALGILLLGGRLMHAVGLTRKRSANGWRSAGVAATYIALFFGSAGLIGHAIL